MTAPRSRYSEKPRSHRNITRQDQTDESTPDSRSTKELHLVDTSQYRNLHASGLLAYAEKTTAIRKADVHIFELMGQCHVMKFNRPMDRTRRRAWASAALCGVLFGKFPSPERLLPGDVRHEALRLRKLREHGVRVPHVYLVTDDHIILEHCGETVEALLKATPPDEQRTRLLWAIVDDLIEFHRAGHWHGGAQIRNLTLKEDSIYRIDFEEQIGAALPLSFAQAFDVLLTFNSMIDHLHGDHQALGIQLLRHYLDHVPSAQIINTLRRLEYWLAYLRRIEPHLNYRLRKKRDLQRTRKFAWILKGALNSTDHRNL